MQRGKKKKTGNWSNQCAIFLHDLFLQVQFYPRHLFSFHNSKTNSTDKAYPCITHTHACTMAMKSDGIKGRLKSCWKEVEKNRGTVLHAGQRGSDRKKSKSLRLKAAKTPSGSWTEDLNEVSVASRATELSIKFRLWVSFRFLFIYVFNHPAKVCLIVKLKLNNMHIDCDQ